MLNLLNKNILITGATGGIGKSIAIKCSNQDANVIITFSKVESIDVLIHHLMFAKNAMLGNIDPTWHKHEEPFDLDSFIK